MEKMDTFQSPEEGCVRSDAKLTDFLTALYSQHLELKKKMDKRDQIHRIELTKLKLKICHLNKMLKTLILEQEHSPHENHSANEFAELKKTSQIILSGYAELQKKFEEKNCEDVNGNVVVLNSSPCESGAETQPKWNVEAVDRLLEESKLIINCNSGGDDTSVPIQESLFVHTGVDEILPFQSQKCRHSSGSENNTCHTVEEYCSSATLLKSKQIRNGNIEVDQASKGHSTLERTRKEKESQLVLNLRKQGMLRFHWTFWVYRKNKKYSYEENLMKGSSFGIWENFISILRSLKSANDLQINSKYIVFKSGIKPIFDDTENTGGGKWVMIFQKTVHAKLNNRWRELLLCVIGGSFGDIGRFISGVEVSVRKKVDKLSVWISKGVSHETAWSIRKIIQDRLILDSTVQLKYQLHPKPFQDGFSDFCL